MIGRFRIHYPDFTLDVDLALPEAGITALFGPSGSGKTTILRCMAGLERAAGGFLSIADEVWQDEPRGIFLPTHKRPLGLVFQETSLFPHLSVLGNLRYGMKRAGNAKGEGFDAMLDLLGIRALLERDPESLSGGERQRVSIARALLTRPRLLLMDEPLSALDMKRKLEILPYLERLRDELSIPVLYVSHSLDEVARLADHLVLIENGKAIANGALMDVLSRLDLDAAFAGETGAVLETTVVAHEADGLTRLEFPGGHIYVAGHAHKIGNRLRCRIHARDVSLALNAHTDTSILNTLPATVVAIADTDTPGHVLVQLKLMDEKSLLLARITERSRQALGIKPGLAVIAQVKSVAMLR
ncbi:MAG: molybdenum ABC transporter ATP-binding protein [Zoogloeaceae bacterium]|jgi:molybdate transport system ATP-binding protein|nr:molybdenum ABC transporter ATP-binding protein [Zoogloeaceae bacterium]